MATPGAIVPEPGRAAQGTSTAARFRSRLVVRERLTRSILDAAEPIAAIVAPPGYSKSTVLAQVAERAPRSATLRLDETHDDPATLLFDLLRALERVMSIPGAVRRAIVAPATANRVTGIARLVGAMGDEPEPLVLLLDDVHMVTERSSRDSIAWMLDRLPSHHRLVLAGRNTDIPGLARAQTRGVVLELGPPALALDRAEIVAAAKLQGLDLSDTEARELAAATDGWPVAVYLAVRAQIGDAPDPRTHASPASPAGPRTRQVLAEYMRTELLDPLDPESQRWLVRASALDLLSGPLCDEALETSGSLRMIRELERTNHLVIPVDAARTTYRLHSLLRELLRDELDVREPGAAREIGARAARWLETEGDILRAVQTAHLAGDSATSARLIARHAIATFQRGQVNTVEGWVEWFDRGELLDRFPWIAVLGGWTSAFAGHTDQAMRWLAAAERSSFTGPLPDGSPDKELWISGLRALMMPFGMARFLADTEAVMTGIHESSPFRAPLSSTLPMVRAVMTGAATEAEDAARSASEMLRAHEAWPGLSLALGEWAGLALERGDLAAADRHVKEGLETIASANLGDYVTSILVEAVAARVATAQGRIREARDHLATFHRIRPQVTTALPWLGVQARLHAIRGCMALREWSAARVLLLEVAEIRQARPDLGALDDEVDHLRTAVGAVRESDSGPWALTNAELRLLAYLPTHLTFREIAERMHLSPHTVKTQTMSIYGKLEASSRREALEQAVQVGLLDPSVLRFTEGADAVA